MRTTWNYRLSEGCSQPLLCLSASQPFKTERDSLYSLLKDRLTFILKPAHILIMQAQTCRSFANPKCAQVLSSVNCRSPQTPFVWRSVLVLCSPCLYHSTLPSSPDSPSPASSHTISIFSFLGAVSLTALLFSSINNNLDDNNKTLQEPMAPFSSLPPHLLVQLDKGLQRSQPSGMRKSWTLAILLPDT